MSSLAGRDPASFGFQSILYVKNGARATVTINRPEVLSCVNLEVLEELSEAFRDASWDDSIAVVVLTGAGDRAFCTGADLKEQEEVFLQRPQDYWKWLGTFIEAHERLRNVGKPTIARLNGLVVGGGNEFNISCDLAIAAEHVTIRQVGAARGSVAAMGATQWLPLIVGDRRAREILWLCEPIPARQALEWGLLNRVVPAAELDAAVDEMCAKLESKLPECMRYTRQQTNFWKDLSWAVTAGHNRDWLSLHAGAYETAEGITAFSEKRLPDYPRLRARAAAPARVCPSCQAGGPATQFEFCGRCGTRIEG